MLEQQGVGIVEDAGEGKIGTRGTRRETMTLVMVLVADAGIGNRP